MKDFVFELQPVLGYKNQVLENLQSEYAITLADVKRNENKLEQIINSHIMLNKEFRQKEKEGITIAQAMQFENGLRVLELDIKQQEKRLELSRQVAEDKRVQVLNAKTDTQALEKLKEKGEEEHRKQKLKEDELFIDEFVSLKRFEKMSAN